MWVMIWCMVSQGAPPLLTGCSPSWNFINFQIYWTIDPGLVCICVPAPWHLIDQANSRRNSHTTNIHTIHNRTWWFSSLKDNLVSEKECLIGIIFRNCQRTGRDHCERREWFDGLGEKEALQSDVLPPMWWLRPCVGVNCYECEGTDCASEARGEGHWWCWW